MVQCRCGRAADALLWRNGKGQCRDDECDHRSGPRARRIHRYGSTSVTKYMFRNPGMMYGLEASRESFQTPSDRSTMATVGYSPLPVSSSVPIWNSTYARESASIT